MISNALTNPTPIKITIELFRKGDGWVAEVSDIAHTARYDKSIEVAAFKAAEMAAEAFYRRNSDETYIHGRSI